MVYFMFESANNIHLQRLFRLRNLAIIGQFTAVAVTEYTLDIVLPLRDIGYVILLITLFNIFVWLRLRQAKVVTENEIFIHLAIDVLALSLLLYFTGGATNPFVLLFLFPLTITVTILPARFAWFLAVLTVICYSLLMFYYMPLPIGHNMHEHSPSSEYNLHLIGMWIAFILNACLITYYVYGMGNTLRRQQKQLGIAREQSIRDEQLVLLGTLAASTAHELGTPLGTMSLLVNELEQELTGQNKSVTSDLANLKKQIVRCKTSLSDLSASVGASSDLFSNKQQAVCEYFKQLIAEIREAHPTAILSLKCNTTHSNSIYTDRTLSLSLINIIENAIEVSLDYIDIKVSLIQDAVKIIITDKGPGLTEEAQEKIGNQPFSDKELGLGLGLYLAHAAIRHRQGKISQTNNINQGSITTIILPLSNQHLNTH